MGTASPAVDANLILLRWLSPLVNRTQRNLLPSLKNVQFGIYNILEHALDDATLAQESAWMLQQLGWRLLVWGASTTYQSLYFLCSSEPGAISPRISTSFKYVWYRLFTSSFRNPEYRMVSLLGSKY